MKYQLHTSFDTRMNEMPVFIAFPRSGNNWINSSMEVYFSRPRLREGSLSVLKNRKDFMWFGDHDELGDIELVHNNLLFMHRNPEDVLFSYSMAICGNINNEFIEEKINILKHHLEYYLIKKSPKQILRYENFVINFDSEFEKIVSFFNLLPLNKEKLQLTKQIVTKELIISNETDKRFFHDGLLSNEYKEKRIEFNKKYKEKIREKIISNELEKYFL